ncbi:hypothetical protein GS597_18835 [Synechococcales cyanobacterium C]|uniref:Fungal lipase-type domain-containing protein n=1 Tax=Petrachloros mirabilis ULC683 TaxID=2781853 RepID=A0A8K2A8X5_9CYAN|nr:lipase family protein [Petrachloros mirabilis]NCJ08526.1 hypothetical protein [Petrachloros mirabilis ULC683]
MECGIDFNVILSFALRSQLAYIIHPQAWHLTERIGWRPPGTHHIYIQEAPKSEVNVVVEVDPIQKIQWIAVRGSSNFKNWILNFRYMQRRFSKNFMDHRVVIDLHTGFYIAADDVYTDILPHLQQNYRTHLTGHSLGGAIAVILMMFLKEDGYHVEQCITFGQPKITDRKGADMCQHLPLVRVIHHEDIVPLLPPRTLRTQLQGGYHHFGAEIILEHETGFHYNPHSTVAKMSTSEFWRSLWRAIAQSNLKSSLEPLQDHDLSFYLSGILQNLKSDASYSHKLTTVF